MFELQVQVRVLEVVTKVGLGEPKSWDSGLKSRVNVELKESEEVVVVVAVVDKEQGKE